MHNCNLHFTTETGFIFDIRKLANPSSIISWLNVHICFYWDEHIYFSKKIITSKPECYYLIGKKWNRLMLLWTNNKQSKKFGCGGGK
jgi:hypothetical protein